MRASLRRLIPKSLLAGYHGAVTGLAAAWYRWPARDLTVVGITGTAGKTTTALVLHAILERAGIATATATTAEFIIRDRHWINDTKMTMLGRFGLQRFLGRARRAECRVVIVETTSEGLAQNRHRGIDYDVAVLTNLSPEHLESHGSFAAYQQAKERLFHVLTLTRRKPGVEKTIVVNADDPAAPAFLRHAADRYRTFSRQGTTWPGAVPLFATNLELRVDGSTFDLTSGQDVARVPSKLLGRMNVENCTAAAAAALALGLPLDAIADGIATVDGIPGRLEAIGVGGLTVIVDYAFLPRAMEELYAVVDQLPHRRTIHVLGGTGGGRDRARRPVLGRIAGERAQLVIVTNEDPYDENPRAIMEQVLEGVVAAGKRVGQDVFVVEDRRAAIGQAIALAEPGDLILVTGKGSEQAIVVAGGRRIPWDDRVVVREALAARFQNPK